MTRVNGHGPNKPPPLSGPSPSTPPLDVLTAQYDALVKQNMAAIAGLQAEGLELDPISLVHRRIDHLIDSIAEAAGKDGPAWALVTRLGFERRMAEAIEEAGSQVCKAVLAEGGRFSSAQIAAMARESGLFRGKSV